MPIRGTTKNVAFAPQGNKNIDPEENFVPYRIDWRNVVLTDAGNRKKRPGYVQKWDIGIDKPIHLLIPYGNGYALTDTSKLYELTATPTDRSGTGLGGTKRPTWTVLDTTPIICDGGTPAKIATTLTALGGSPPIGATHVDVLGPYTLMCGHHATEFKWSASNNPENWTTGDSGFANVKKDGTIKAFMVNAEKAAFFKDQSTEVWYNRGGTTPFVRIEYVERGIGAAYSLVLCNGVFYWLGDDYRFYRHEGVTPVLLSSPYEKYIQSIPDPSQIYGLHFAKEHLIKWVSPLDGKTLVYDYRHNIWSEDNRWEFGQWARLPINSYMEMSNKQYFGSYNSEGLIYEWSENYMDDAGQPIRLYENFVVIASGDEAKSSRYNRARFRLKRGVATSSIIDPTFMFRYRLDRGDWSQEDQLMGKVGDYYPYIDKHNLGVGIEAEFEIAFTDATEFLLTDMALTTRTLGR